MNSKIQISRVSITIITIIKLKLILNVTIYKKDWAKIVINNFDFPLTSNVQRKSIRIKKKKKKKTKEKIKKKQDYTRTPSLHQQLLQIRFPSQREMESRK